MIILAIETSCDETSVSVIMAEGGFEQPKFKILSNIVTSQIELHAKWGGVVPNLAQREHQKNLIPILKEALEEAGLLEKWQGKIDNPKIEKLLYREDDLLKQFLEFIPKIKIPEIDVIAVTNGPGLEPALWVGVNFAKALSLAWNKPIVATNHLEGHICSALLTSGTKFSISNFQFPTIALLVSGGHTQLVLIEDWLKYKIIGQTRDDAVGEAFDKVARMLDLGYPGGPKIATCAAQIINFQFSISKQNSKITLPRPMMNSGDFDFSFSGLKTAVLYKIQELSVAESRKLKAEICHEFQQACIDVLISKTIKAVEKYNAKNIIIGGGVAANEELRTQLKNAVEEKATNCELLIPEISLTGDNAAMIGAASYLHALKKDFVDNIDDLKAHGNLPLS